MDVAVDGNDAGMLQLGRAGEKAIETSFAGLSDIRGQVAQIAEQI